LKNVRLEPDLVFWLKNWQSGQGCRIEIALSL
jgi:hypothetical protein